LLLLEILETAQMRVLIDHLLSTVHLVKPALEEKRLHLIILLLWLLDALQRNDRVVLACLGVDEHIGGIVYLLESLE
jgi:hypothetical protein